MKNTILKSSLFLIASFVIITALSSAVNKRVITETFKVEGCCGECKERIEDALDIKGVKYSNWDIESRQLTVTFSTKKISLDQIHNKIAEKGHDTELVQASDSAYSTLPECCQYRGGHECLH